MGNTTFTLPFFRLNNLYLVCLWYSEDHKSWLELTKGSLRHQQKQNFQEKYQSL